MLGPFNNYVDKKRGVGSQWIVHGGSLDEEYEKWPFLFTQGRGVKIE